MMAQKMTERPADEPDLELTDANDSRIKTQLFGLDDGECLDMSDGGPERRIATGPALVYRSITPTGVKTELYGVNNADTWTWIGLLIERGAAGFGVTVTSRRQA